MKGRCTVWLFCCGGARRDFKHRHTDTGERGVHTCNFFVGKETYLDVMFMCIYYVHVLYVNTFFYRVPLLAYSFFLSPV